MSCRRKIPCAVFRLQIVDGKDEAILCEGSCKQWYHRGCASLPPERYKDLSASDEPFLCLICTCLDLKKEVSSLSSAVTSLREELRDARKVRESVTTLEKEVSALKESLKEASRQIEEAKKPQRQPRSYANATNGASYAATSRPHDPRRNVRKLAQQRSRPGNAPVVSSLSGGGNRSGAENTAGSATKTATSPATRELVRGARRVWGTLPLITCTTVKNTISRLTNSSCMNELQIRRKFVNGQSTRSGKNKWWFVLHGNEESLQSLEAGWETVKLQTGWQLEQCTKPSEPPCSLPPCTDHVNSPSDTECANIPTNVDATNPHAFTNSVTSPDQIQSPTTHSFLETTTCNPTPPVK